MHSKNRRVGLLRVASVIALLAASPVSANDLVVNNLTADRLHVNQMGTGVGIYLGNRTPFGQALIETDLTAPATHAWFTENGNRVFSVAGGGDGFFKGNLEVDGFATFKRGVENLGVKDLTVADRLDIGPPSPTAIAGGGGDPRLRLVLDGNGSIFGNVSFGAQTRQMLSLWKNNQTEYGIGVQNFGLYQRTGRDFFWYKGGTHSDTFGDAGGGTLLMHLDDTGNLLFGAQTRQMLSLFDTTYGIGVQAGAFYQRTGNEFFWYQGGTHSDTFGDAGGGQQLMRLGNNGTLIVSGWVVTSVLQITGGTDVAEPFQMSREDIPPGAVVIIDDENVGQLRMSETAYDKRVAGIVSGANGINPGISLSQQGVIEGGQNVALSGRVYVLADASTGPIKPGDLLTTSNTPGYAMAATDHAKAQGAVIGKAMSALRSGKGTVLVLVTLQ
jgi:hypothetical protein